MLDIRFAGLPRFVVGFALPGLPDNSDGPGMTEAMAGGRFPRFPVSGINWTHHTRPQPPVRPGPRRSHLKVVK